MKNYYAVRVGRQPGVYQTWTETQTQIHHFKGAQFKGFDDLAAAQAFVEANHSDDFVADDTTYQIYTDGGCRNHGNHQGGKVRPNDLAAWAFQIKYQKQVLVTKAYGLLGATNNQMEVLAVINALQWLIDKQKNHQPIQLIADSKYVIDNITTGNLKTWAAQNWRQNTAHPVKNMELWQKLSRQLAQFTNLHFKWVKGHSVNYGNNEVDGLVNQAMDELKPTKSPR